MYLAINWLNVRQAQVYLTNARIKVIFEPVKFLL